MKRYDYEDRSLATRRDDRSFTIFDRRIGRERPIARALDVASAQKIVDALNASEPAR